MKKRILSMLLLVVMLVTALPLTVLTALAAEENEVTYDEADYNALYVQDGLAVALDYFTTNTYWGKPALATNAEAYLWQWTCLTAAGARDRLALKADAGVVANGYMRLTTNTQLGSTQFLNNFSVNGMTAEFVMQDNKAATAAGGFLNIDDLRFTLKQNGDQLSVANVGQRTPYNEGILRTPEVYSTTVNASGGVAYESYKPYVPTGSFTYKDAVRTYVVQATTPAHTVNYYSYYYRDLFNAKGQLQYAATYKVDGVELVLPTDDQIKSYGVTQKALETGDSTYFYITHKANGEALEEAVQKQFAFNFPVYTVIGDKAYITDYVYRPMNMGIGNGKDGANYFHSEYGSLAFYVDGDEVFSSDTLIWPDNKGISGGTYLRYGSGTTRDVYAYRSYDRTLTEDELAQNHFADIAKWFKLDISVLGALEGIDKAKLYRAFADYTFESDRDAAQDLLVAKVREILEDEYAGTSASPYAQFALDYSLDLSPLLENARGALPKTYAYLDSILAGTAAPVDVKATYEAMLALDLASDWTEAQYNALYAAQDNLLFRIDFYRLNDIWGGEMRELLSPPDNDNYLYDDNGDGIKERYDFTVVENRLGSYVVKKTAKADGAVTYDANGGTSAVNFGKLTAAYAHNNFAAALARALKDAGNGATEIKDGETVIGYQSTNGDKYTVASQWIVVRMKGDDDNTWNYLNASAKFSSGDEMVFVTEADALAKAKALSGVTDAAEGEKKFLSTDGYTYYAVNKFVLANPAYKKATADLQTEAKNLLLEYADQKTESYYIAQYLPSVNTLSYQSYQGGKDVRPGFVAQNGYLQMMAVGSNQYLQFKGFAATGGAYMEMVMAGGEATLTGHTFLHFRDFAPKFLVNANGVSTSESVLNYGLEATKFDKTGTFEDRYTPFTLSIYSDRSADQKTNTITFIMDGQVLLDERTIADTNGGSPYYMLNFSVSAARNHFYATRWYDCDLTAAEKEQNHFADIAKWFKLNLTGIERLSDKDLSKLYASVKDYTFFSDRTEVQDTVTAILNAAIKAEYEAIKTAYPTVPAAFIDLAYEYRLDLTKVLESDKDMSSVYATTFNRLNYAEAQARLDEAYYDAITFYPLMIKGEDAWNAWVLKVANANTVDNIDRMLVLPLSVRREIVSVENNTDADVIAAFITEKLNAYDSTLTEDRYNSLYVTDGLALAFDVMGTNPYWGKAFADYPTYPTELTAYEYDMNGDGEIDPTTEVFDFTKLENRYVYGRYGIKKVRKSDNYMVGYTASVEMPATGKKRDNTIVTFATFAEAEAKAKELAEADATYNYEVLLPYLVGYRMTDANAPSGYSGYAMLSESYETFEEADAAHTDFTGRDYFVMPNDISPAFYAAVDEFYVAEAAWMKQYTWSIAALKTTTNILSGNPLTSGNGFSHIRDFAVLHAAYDTPVNGLGYLTQAIPHVTDNGFTLTQNIDAYHSTGASAQIVAKTGNLIGNGFSLFFNARPTVTVDKTKGEFTVTGFNSQSGFKKTEDVTTGKTLPTEKPISMTISLSGSLTTDAVENKTDVYKLETPLETIYEAKGNYTWSSYRNPATGKYEPCLNQTNQLGYGNSFGGGEVYAVRYYTRDLSTAEILQNNFADVAKWYRLDITEYENATPEQRAQINALFAKYTVNDATYTREEIMEEYYGFFYDYTGVEATLGTEMIAIAKKLGLNVSALMAAKEEVRAYAEALVLADFKADQPMERSVIQSLIDQALVYKAGFNFEGVQVRVQSASEADDMPGVRAIFSVNRTAIEAYAALGKAVTFGVEICNADGTTLSTLYFTVNRMVDEEGNVTYTYTGKNGEDDAIIREVGENSLAFAYTVIFDEEAVQTKSYYEFEFGYRFFMEVDGLRNNADAIYSPTFEGTISAAEAYRYFYTHGYENDRVVQSVIRELNGGNDVILVKTAEEAQEALDNATVDTTIQLAPGVDYGTLTFRQTASSTVVDITDAGGDAPGNEKYRRIENLTILGAEGAIVDGFDFLVSWIDGSGASYIDIKNLTVEGVTFSGEATPFQLTKGSLGIDGLTLVDCRMEDADGNNRLVFQQINGYKVLTDKSTGEYVMTTGVKDLTITGCEVVGAYMVIESRAMENLTITDNTFYGIKERDMLITSDTTHYPQMTYSGTITITGNTSECGEERFVRASLNNSDVTVLIKDNTIINYLGADADYIKVTEIDAANVTIENNILVP